MVPFEAMTTPQRGTEGKGDNGLAEDLEASADAWRDPDAPTAEQNEQYERVLREADEAKGDAEKLTGLRIRALAIFGGDVSRISGFDLFFKPRANTT